MILVDNLSIGYGGVPILEGLNFEIRRGEIFILLGGSGCGKSTMLRTLVGLQPPIHGTIQIEDIGMPHLDPDRSPSCGVMFQSGALFGSMTLAENVALPLRKWTDLDAHGIDAIVRAKLRLVGLGGFENHLPAEISGGMKKRAGIARALALDPALLFLDEPSAGLDPISAVELDDLILALNRSLGMTVVVVTHELESIFRIGQRCVMLDKQARGLIAEGDPRELRDHSSHPTVHSFFNRLPLQGA